MHVAVHVAVQKPESADRHLILLLSGIWKRSEISTWRLSSRRFRTSIELNAASVHPTENHVLEVQSNRGNLTQSASLPLVKWLRD